MKLPISVNLERFSVVELIALIAVLTICLVVFMTCVVGIWRQMRLEVIEHVYRLLDQMLALIAGLLGGKALANSKGDNNGGKESN